MWAATYPESFGTINSTAQNANWLPFFGCLFVLLFFVLIKGNSKRLLSAVGLNELWLSAVVIWFLFFGLGDVWVWMKQIYRNAADFNRPTELRQGRRICEMWQNQFNLKYCSYDTFYAKIKLVPEGAKVYWFPTLFSSDLYLRYWLAPKHQIVNKLEEAEYVVMIYPTSPISYRQGRLQARDKQGKYHDLGEFELLGNLETTSVFKRMK